MRENVGRKACRRQTIASSSKFIEEINMNNCKYCEVELIQENEIENNECEYCEQVKYFGGLK